MLKILLCKYIYKFLYKYFGISLHQMDEAKQKEKQTGKTDLWLPGWGGLEKWGLKVQTFRL